MTEKPETRTAYTDGLRAVADWLDQHPEVPLPYLGAVIAGDVRPVLPIFLVNDATARADLAVITRAMGKASKSVNVAGDRFQVYRGFEGLIVMAQAPREQVCTRVVTGTEDREVEETVTPAVTRKIVKAVEIVEWTCEPLLAEAPAPDAVPDGESYEGPVLVTMDASPPKPPYGTPERTAWDEAHPPGPARSPVRDADDMFDAAFGTRPGGTARTS